jgi:hypothetical protein
VKRRRPIASLVWPTIVLILGIGISWVISVGIGAGETPILHLILPIVFVLFGISRWIQFFANPVSEIFIVTTEGRDGLLYMSRHRPTFKEFRNALLLALKENTHSPIERFENSES